MRNTFRQFRTRPAMEAVGTLILVAIMQGILLTSLSLWWRILAALVIAGLAGLGLSWATTSSVRRTRACLARHSEKLVSAPARELNREEADLPVRLHSIVEASCDLTGAQSSILDLTCPALVIRAAAQASDGEGQHEGAGLLTALVERYIGHLEDLRGSSTLISAPVVSGGQMIGHLTLQEKKGELPFGPEDEALLRWCAMRVALCLEDDHRRRRMKEQAITEERERIAREMHDSLAQVLGYINTKGQVVQELMRRGRMDQAETQLEQLVRVAHTACGDIREEILALRSTPEPDGDMLDTLCDYLRRWEQFTGVETQLEISNAGAVLPLAPEARLQLLRIIQAALSNVRKHAEASRVWVRIQLERGRLETTIVDNGVGFNEGHQGVTMTPRFGLAMMRERAETVGGELEVSSTPRAGTRVVTRLPINDRYV